MLDKREIPISVFPSRISFRYAENIPNMPKVNLWNPNKDYPPKRE